MCKFQGYLTPKVTNFVDSLWNCPTLLGRPGIVRYEFYVHKFNNRDDPLTWEGSNWPPDANNKGFLPLDLTFAESWNIRENPKVYHIFSLILKNPALLCSLDRVGVMRPTRGCYK